MKIGIVTQPLIHNYGGILQNYAMQQVLKNLGHEPVTLDFMYGSVGVRHYLSIVHLFLLHIRNPKIPIMPPKTNRRYNQDIRDFVNKHIVVSKMFWKRYSPKLVDKYGLEAVVVGSDQVWRPRYNPDLDDMFLRFTKDKHIRRVAYAASFGTSEWEFDNISNLPEYKALLKLFNAISVREESGIGLVNRFGVDAVKVQDPTLLLGRRGFDNLVGESTETHINYLAAYILDLEPAAKAHIEELVKNSDMAELKIFHENQAGMGPIQWIESIKNSKFLITDSFHGTVFAILYHIPFYSVVNIFRGGDRFTSLLRPLGLESRMVSDIREIDDAMMRTQSIDWDSVDAALNEERVESLEFLKAGLA